jgi:parallel beta-helix repeat protein
MITLSQIEPRTPITNLPYTITASGSYYLTTNLTCRTCSGGVNGITILLFVDNVTLDLNGFTLIGTNGSGSGIRAPSLSHNYAIRNGTLRNWGADGVNAFNSINNRFEGLQLYGNAHIGLEAGIGSIVANCEAYSNTVAGFLLQTGDISHCVAVGNGTGIVASTGCVVADCTASSNSGDGINCAAGLVVRSCAANQNAGNGITTSDNCTVIGCTASGGSGGLSIGIQVGNNCTVKDCTASSNTLVGTDGLYGGGYSTTNCTVIGCTASRNGGGGIVVGPNSTVKDCTASGNAGAHGFDGIDVFGKNCQIAGNTCSGNANNGIFIFGGQSRIDGNSIGNNGAYGINPSSANVTNSITRNSAPGNGSGGYGNYSGNNDYAPTGTPSTATSPWANF